MTVLALKRFTGQIPRLPPDRLPDDAAFLAVNCNLAHGELRSLTGPAPKIHTTGAVRSLFTDNGLRFFAWPVPTRASLSPTIGDVHERVYFANAADGFRVTQAGQMQPALLNPRPPTSSWRVGVGRPTEPPVLVLIDSEVWKTDYTATPQIKLFWEVAGRRAAELNVTDVQVVRRWREYLVTVAAGESLPEGSSSISGESPSRVVVEAIQYRNVTTDEWGAVNYGPEQELAINEDVALTDGRVRILSTGQMVPSSSVFFGRGEITLVKKSGFWFTYAQLLANLQTGTPVTNPGSVSSADTGAALAVEFSINGADGTRHLTRFSTNSAQEGSGRYTAAVIGEEVSANQYRVLINWDPVETVSYVTTAQNDWGEESASSPPTMIDIDPVQNVRIHQPYVPLDDGARPVAGLNYYRTFVANQSADFILLNKVPQTSADANGYVALDGHPTPPTTTVLQSVEWDHPPAALANLSYAGNGALCGSVGRDLHFSEPYRPHAWPYTMTLPHAIIGIVEVEGGLLVTTAAQPYFVYGAHPQQMSQQPINAEQAGWSGRAMARVGGAAVFASNDGLVSVAGGQASISDSQQLFTRADWRLRFSAARRNLLLGAWDGMLIGAIDPSYPFAQSADAFLIRLDEAPGYSKLDVGLEGGRIVGLAVSATTDELYLCYEDGFAEFGIGAPLELTWMSRVFEYPRPIAFAAAIVDCDGAFTVTLYGDDDVIHSETVFARTTFRLPPVGPARRWQVGFSGTGTVRAFEMGASFAELHHV